MKTVPGPWTSWHVRAALGRMRIVAAIHSPGATRKILECLGLPSRPPPLKPAQSPNIEWL
jgi:hypothetical protein